MNHPDTDPYGFSLWPGASAINEETWRGYYAQPGHTDEGIPLDILDAMLAWGQGGTSLTEMTDFQNNSEVNWTSEGTVATELSSYDLSLPDTTATCTAALAPTMPPFPSNDSEEQAQQLFFTQPNVSHFGTPFLTDESSLPSPESDTCINGYLGLLNSEVVPSFVQPPGPSLSQFDFVGAWGPNQIACAPPTWPIGGSNLAGQVQSDFGPLLDPINGNTYPAAWDSMQPTGHLSTPTEALATVVTREEKMPVPSLGKRRRLESNDTKGRPKKRGRPAETRVLGGAESTKKTRSSPVTRTRTNVKGISKAAGHGAERLVSTKAQGVYSRPLPGLRVPHGSVGALALEQPSWVEEREVVETQRDTRSSMPQQVVLQEHAEDMENLREIPRRLLKRERLLLRMTQAEEERGGVRVIRCKLCPKAQFSGWETFQRHCKSCEKHPAALTFCPRCGDYFGRSDSRDRHNENGNQEACLRTPQHEAREKREMVERLLEAFEVELMDCLNNGLDIISCFSDVVSQKLGNTSKKVSKAEEIALDGDSWFAGLC